MLGVKHNSLINPNIRTIDDILKDKCISKEAKDIIIKNEIKKRLSKDNVEEKKDE
tara:strand:+ start:150 stop:314 length:165 start_codon:yes stop_codon:yes gene_type:complete